MKFPPEKFNSVQAHSLIAELDAALLEKEQPTDARDNKQAISYVARAVESLS